MITPSAEWLEADGLGGFAFGRVDGVRTRRYHAVLAVATTPPTGRIVLVNGFDAWVETPDGQIRAHIPTLHARRHAPGRRQLASSVHARSMADVDLRAA